MRSILMYGYIYKITNLVNGSIYIGKKKSPVFLDKEYMGSGRIITQAINKYGIDNFTIEAIDWSSSREEQNEQEKYWIRYYRETGVRLYNIANGGDGGDTYSYLSAEDKIERGRKLSEVQKNRSPEKTQQIVAKRKETIERRGVRPGPKYGNKPWNTGKTKETDKRVAANSEAIAMFHKNNPGKYSGWKQTPEAIEKIRTASYGNKHGVGNKSTRGCRHIHKGTVNTCVPEEELPHYLDEGWQLGQYKKPHEYYNAQQIRCIETNTLYTSISSASDQLNISEYYLKKAANNQKPHNGLHFEWV